MKTKVIALSCLIGAVVLFMSYESGIAASKKPDELKIGVVSVLDIFQKCKRNEKYREEALAERDRIESELSRLIKEVQSDEEGLKKAFKPGSPDYMIQVKQIYEKQAKVQAQKKF